MVYGHFDSIFEKGFEQGPIIRQITFNMVQRNFAIVFYFHKLCLFLCLMFHEVKYETLTANNIVHRALESCDATQTN